MDVGTEITTEQDIEAMLDASREGAVVLFKHSLACAASARMAREVVALDAPDDPPVYVVTVQGARRASTALAERLGVRHETPQAIVVHGGEAVLHLSHSAIAAERLRAAAHGATRSA